MKLKSTGTEVVRLLIVCQNAVAIPVREVFLVTQYKRLYVYSGICHK